MIHRYFRHFLAASLLLASGSADAQPAASPPSLPPGHPPIAAPNGPAGVAPTTQAVPAAKASSGHAAGVDTARPAGSSNKAGASAAQGHAAQANTAQGHAPPASTAAAPQAQPAPPNPHAAPGGLPQVPQDESLPATDLPKGSIEVVVLDAQEAPQAGAEVHLHINFSRISEGESHNERTLRTDAEGRARFDGLSAASEYSYQAVVPSGAAEYSSAPFNLNENVGQRLRLHVFPVTRDIGSAMVGMRGFVYIEPRDDVFAFEVLYRVFNIGAVTWVPENVVMHLPDGFKAFSAPKGMSNTTFEQVDGEGARLVGTFDPGQHDVSFRFQVPKLAEPGAIFRIGALPRTAELRVIAEASSHMSLTVDGFETPQVSTNQQGKRVLVTRFLSKTGNELDGGASISLDGMPVPGNGRWIALAIAAALAAVGLASAWGYMRLDPDDQRQNQDLASAKELLLAELVAVERARRAGQLGPRAHAEAKRTLLDALARLGSDVLAPPVRKKRRRAAA